ncbi:peptide ABC transporter substrate-binding protein [Lentilactobacillus farraginis]|uniref:Oligopeptide ABC superfamily ATP binding cassette transporter, substrate binding protein n=1 Tax=Lentilactobacillus farraginis DSM 18382 = JCM 14108 TaxID=1423743 RepID=X0PA75_9LACO|nr:peptide ABC transporter substrate-binding protein [Lentilactobacillus farraginis]KRM11491.1 oligopeptide ABC superfamily ATP binding cassette transporter, substrate binding protein [Lentilactobacillus farraginis DSM 18382 = JCM 14108]GAF36098.1 oligopeptide ABC transporter, periplasmic oligopeptide-binding protein OppA [Lentilactobacillus farraginis DSM 18382 = JCM 14108]
MRAWKQVSLLLSVTGVSLILVGCGKAKQSANKQIIRTSIDSELTSVDLSKTTALNSFTVLNNVDEGLFRLGKNSKIEPGIAKSYTESKDGKTYTFNLRKNAKWSNGDPVTAQDFVYSWRRTLNPKTSSQYGYLFSGIKNADKIQNSKAPVSSLGIKANGKYKLTVTLENRLPFFKLLMGFPVFFPQDAKAVQKYGSRYGTSANRQVYNGPFTLTKWTGSNLSWTLKKNPYYWDKKHVKLDQVKYSVIKDPTTGLNLYNQKKLDMNGLSNDQAKQYSKNKNIVTRKQSSSYYIAFNQKKKVFANLKIRQAISMAINRKVMVNKVVGGGAIQNTNFVSKGLAVSPTTGKDFTSETTIPASMSYNLPKAKQLFKQGLAEEGRKSLSFTLMAGDDYATKQLTEYLQSALEKLPGLKVSLNNIPARVVLSRQADQQFQVTVADWFADYSDPVTFLNILTSKNPSNISKWQNTAYDKLIAKSNGQDAAKPQARWNDMIAAQNLALKDQAIVPLYQSGEKWLINPKVKDVIYNTAGPNYNYKDAYVK